MSSRDLQEWAKDMPMFSSPLGEEAGFGEGQVANSRHHRLHWITGMTEVLM